jgi:hypothetical protein
MKIEITPDQMDSIIAQGLAEDLDSLEKDLERAHKNKRGFVYSVVYEEDVKELMWAIQAYKKVLAFYQFAADVPAPEEEPECSKDPAAPHGFDRNASHTAGRYVCECEAWEANK